VTPTTDASRQLQPYAVLGVAGIVVATVFAAVASLAAEPATDHALPLPSAPAQATTTTSRLPVVIAPPANSAAAVVTTTKPKPTTTTPKTTTPPKPTTTTQVPKRPPVGVLQVNCSGLTCTFDATRSSDVDGTIIYYAWSFGRGEGGEEGAGLSRTTHRYDRPGSYSVTLLIMDDDGITDTTTRQIFVNGS
jgi:PKD repeat protein